MLFNLDLAESTITILYVKMTLADFMVYFGAAVGFMKNYWTNLEIAEGQKKQHELQEKANLLKESENRDKKAEKKDAAKRARRSYIVECASDFFWKIERVARQTPMKGDDKLFDYIKAFSAGMNSVFGDQPTDEEVQMMKDKAFTMDMELKAKEGKLPLSEADVE